MRPAFGVAFLLFAVVLLAFLVVPACGCQSRHSAMATACLSNLKQQASGLLQYADDHDERLTARDAWMDGVAPYVKQEGVFHDPELPKGSYGYAFNAALSSAKPPKDPEKVPMVYDSVNPIRNASDRVTSLPKPGRHGGKNTMGYADGHMKRVKDGGRREGL